MPVSVRLAVEAATRADGSIDPEATVWLTRAMATAPFGRAPAREKNESFEWVLRPPPDLAEVEVYTGGSLIDNDPEFQGHCVSLGWAFVVVRRGVLLAAAHGRPPGWVTTIFGAELWAVRVAMTSLTPGGRSILTDCNAVRIGSERDRKWATGPGRLYARICG